MPAADVAALLKEHGYEAAKLKAEERGAGTALRRRNLPCPGPRRPGRDLPAEVGRRRRRRAGLAAAGRRVGRRRALEGSRRALQTRLGEGPQRRPAALPARPGPGAGRAGQGRPPLDGRGAGPAPGQRRETLPAWPWGSTSAGWTPRRLRNGSASGATRCFRRSTARSRRGRWPRRRSSARSTSRRPRTSGARGCTTSEFLGSSTWRGTSGSPSPSTAARRAPSRPPGASTTCARKWKPSSRSSPATSTWPSTWSRY